MHVMVRVKGGLLSYHAEVKKKKKGSNSRYHSHKRHVSSFTGVATKYTQ